MRMLVLSGILDLQCWLEGSWVGDPIEKVTLYDSNECLEACKDNGYCNWFTYATIDDRCKMFESCPDLDMSCNTCVSGHTECHRKDNGAVANQYFTVDFL